MTVSNEICTVTYTANGSTQDFTVPFKFFDKEIEVYLDGTSVKNYTVTPTAATGAGMIHFDRAPSSGVKVLIKRHVPLTQQVVFIEGEDFPAHDYEYSLDRLYMALQENDQKIKNQINTYSKTEVDGLLNGKANTADVYTKTEIQAALAGKADKTDLNAKANVSDVYTKSEVDEKIPLVPKVIKAEDLSTEGKVWGFLLPGNEYYAAGYRYEIYFAIEGATEDMVPLVTFNIADALSGNFAPVAEAQNGYVRLFAKESVLTVIKTIVLV